VQQQNRAQRQRQARDLRAKTIERAAEPETPEVGVTEQRVAAQFAAAVSAEGGVNKLLDIEREMLVVK
jgi:hypothetical protein